MPEKFSRLLSLCAVTILFCLAWALLGLGGAVLRRASGYPVPGFWSYEKLAWGLLPIILSLAVWIWATRLWARAFRCRWSASLAWIAVVILTLAVDLTAIVRYRNRDDDSIRVQWHANSAKLDWGRGEVCFPAGYTWRRLLGIDSQVGEITSPDGRLVVRYDIGYLSAEHGGMARVSFETAGARVRSGHVESQDEEGNPGVFYKVSFPDSGCAQFDLLSADPQAAALMESLARSHHPHGWTPAWLRRLLPEILRSDCRYRIRPLLD